jgi:hypothetical protein
VMEHIVREVVVVAAVLAVIVGNWWDEAGS